MDKPLRDIQVELLPGREPAPPLAAPGSPLAEPELALAAVAASEPAPAAPAAVAASEPTPAAPTAPPPPPDPQIQALSELAAGLLASMRELLAGYERVLVRPSSPPPARRTTRRPADSPDVTLSAGPFPSLDALREFEQAVSSLPGVREVAVRGYEGTDRAIIEVRLHRDGPEPRREGRNP
jgi:hypothetical protein